MATSASLPPACYADGSVALIERDAIYRTSWIGVGCADQWEAAQQYALPAIPSLGGRNRNGTRYTWLFPNMTFAASTEAI